MQKEFSREEREVFCKQLDNILLSTATILSVTGLDPVPIFESYIEFFKNLQKEHALKEKLEAKESGQRVDQ